MDNMDEESCSSFSDCHRAPVALFIPMNPCIYSEGPIPITINHSRTKRVVPKDENVENQADEFLLQNSSLSITTVKLKFTIALNK